MSELALPARIKKGAAVYTSLAGVDMSGEARGISPARASGSANMYKRYVDGFSDFVETRPGIDRLLDLDGRIYGLHFITLPGGVRCLIHAGDSLYAWQPGQSTAAPVRSGMNPRDSVSFVFDGRLFLFDGAGYYEYDGSACRPVTGTVPVTSIARAPAGGGTPYQSVNILTPLRRNSFRGDGSSREYHLDATEIDAAVTATVNGAEVSGVTVNAAAGTVTFLSAPPAPDGGDDNVIIEFSRTVSGHAGILPACTCACLFDNRVFAAGGANKNVLWHSEVNDPRYFADVNYYKDGDDAPVTGLAVQAGSLVAAKDTGGNRPGVFVHTPALDYELGRTYPVRQTAITMGCVAPGGLTAFRDDLVCLSAQGLEGLDAESGSVCHRSTLVDGALLAAPLAQARLQEWNGYLCCLAGGDIYLADSRGRFGGAGYEYEWFYWPRAGLDTGGAFSPACTLREYGGILYFGTLSGAVGRFYGGDDDGAGIESEWVTRAETFGNPLARKSAGKNGAQAQLKTIPNSRVSISVIPDSGPERLLCSVNMGGLDFSALDFSALSFAAAGDSIIPLPLVEKCFRSLRLRFHSSRAFGLGGAAYFARTVDIIE